MPILLMAAILVLILILIPQYVAEHCASTPTAGIIILTIHTCQSPDHLLRYSHLLMQVPVIGIYAEHLRKTHTRAAIRIT